MTLISKSVTTNWGRNRTANQENVKIKEADLEHDGQQRKLQGKTPNMELHELQ